jgi:subtilase family serine protease
LNKETGRLKRGKGKNIPISYNLPLGETASGKYIIVMIDVDNIIVERDETNNNIVYGPIQ